MRIIPFPSRAGIVALPLWLEYPGQEPLESPYDATLQVLERSLGRWSGRVVLRECGVQDGPELRQVEAFLASMQGLVNTVKVPIMRPSAGSFSPFTHRTLSFQGVVSGSGLRTVNIQSDSAFGTERLVLGDYVSLGDRLYILTEDLGDVAGSAARLTVAPPVDVVPASGSSITWEDVTLLCRIIKMREGWSGAEFTPDFAGPWSLTLQEVV